MYLITVVAGTEARQAVLADRASQLQACAKTWLSKISRTSADRVAVRLVQLAPKALMGPLQYTGLSTYQQGLNVAQLHLLHFKY